MGLFGALFTGVSGLNAESESTAMIANNIANTNTIGYKRSESSFSSLVTTQSRSVGYTPGAVNVTRLQRVDQQGPIQSTQSSTDAAITGSGFFPVKIDATDSQEFLYTRNGSFSEDSSGFLRNAAGFVLYAWPLDQDGNLPANQGDLASLVPADVAFLGGLTRPTTSGEISLILNSSEENLNTNNIPTADGAGGIQLPVPVAQSADFQRSLTVFDSLGSQQSLNFQYRKITGPMANITSRNGAELSPTDSIVDSLNDVNANESIEFALGGETLIIEFVANDGDPATIVAGAGETVVTAYTVQDMVDAVNDHTFGATDGLISSINPQGQILVQARDLTDDFTIDDGVGTAASGGVGTFDFGDAGALPINVNHTDIPGTYPDNATVFPDFSNGTTPNTFGWWEVKVLQPNGNTITEGVLNFDSDGNLNAISDASGNIDLELNDIDWGNGSSLQDIAVDIERYQALEGEPQVNTAEQNGAALGLRTGIDITSDGVVVARFSNGSTADLYQIPLVTFSNENGLNEESGTAYSESTASGEENLREAGTGGAGFFQAASLEGSNVDLAAEFARLIVSQRVFSANSRVVNTVDELTQELLRLR